jgi:hypothetical protein
MVLVDESASCVCLRSLGIAEVEVCPLIDSLVKAEWSFSGILDCEVLYKDCTC